MLVPAFCHTHPFRTKEHRLMVIGGPGGDGGYVVAMSWNSPRFGVGIQASQSLSLTFSFSFSLCISMYPVFTSKKYMHVELHVYYRIFEVKVRTIWTNDQALVLVHTLGILWNPKPG
jgi:hypothetical protein